MEDLAQTSYRLVRGGTTLHYQVAGPLDRPLVVFTHGEGMNQRMFEPQLAVVAREYRVLLWDVHGHGRSQPSGMGGVFSLRTVVADLLAILDQLGYQQATFVGHALGASIVQELAFLHPERVTALVIIGGTNLTMPVSRRRVLAQRFLARICVLLPTTLFAWFIVKLSSIHPEVQAYARQASARLARSTWLALFRAQPGFFHAEADYRLRKPLLLTHGERDAFRSVREQAPLWARRASNCRYVVVPRAGHNANQDNPEFFNAVLLFFLSLYVPVSSDENFLQFLLAAKRHTYAARGTADEGAPLLEGSQQLEYRTGPYFYRDIYFGMAYFVGQETVYKRNTPTWAMSYAGGVVAAIVEEKEIKSIYAFLREAMVQVPPENPYRGPREFVAGPFCYRDENQGDLLAFSGVETITRDGQLVYQLRYHGGFLR